MSADPLADPDGVVCARCGVREPGPPLTWSSQAGESGVVRLCARCTREHVRDIECRLDERWW